MQFLAILSKLPPSSRSYLGNPVDSDFYLIKDTITDDSSCMWVAMYESTVVFFLLHLNKKGK